MNEGDRPGNTKDRILIVDDNQNNVEIIATRLQFRGYEVRGVATGPQAVDEVRRDPPDLILIDRVPDGGTLDVVRQIKERQDCPFIPTIVVLANDATQDELSALDAGADQVITKPINFPALEGRIRALLRIKRLID